MCVCERERECVCVYSNVLYNLLASIYDLHYTMCTLLFISGIPCMSCSESISPLAVQEILESLRDLNDKFQRFTVQEFVEVFLYTLFYDKGNTGFAPF